MKTLRGGPMLAPLGRVVLAVLVALAALTPAAAAQSVSGSLAGTVVDQTRQLVPGASVTLVNEQTGDSRATTSNETGVFVFSAVQPGAYTVRVELAGFATFELRNTVVPANEQVPVGALQLNVGTLTETVTATSTGSFVQTLSFDAIGEVQVELNNYRAEYGRNGGPVVNIVTKSGTKQYKGSAYWFKRHEALNANDFFNSRNGVAKPLYRFDTVGATLGGPVPLPKPGRDKLFFFYSFDGLRSLNPRPLQQVTTPTALERAGDFSQTLDTNGRLIVVRDPLTGLPFLNNMIPTPRINRSGQALLGVFPLPNALDRAVTRGAYNYNFQESLDVPKRQNV